MATFPNPEWSVDLQKALGLEGKCLKSMEVELRVAEDEVVTACVSYEEFVDDDRIKQVTRCLVPIEFNEVAWKTSFSRTFGEKPIRGNTE